jgi:hypothetical protein
MKVNKQQKKYGPLPGTRIGKGTVGVYPEVIDEYTTLDLITRGSSIARYGDGEINLALGGTCVSQREYSDKLRDELRLVLREPGKCLVGIPNVFSETPKRASWSKFATTNICSLYTQPKYVSSFITRPDSAPWIDTADYWNKVKTLWVDRDVTLVIGGLRSLRPDAIKAEARSVREVWGPRTNAYREIDRIEEEVGQPSGPILICLGPTATILAWRLAQKGLWAMDLGHLGMFMRHGGSYRHKIEDLVSTSYMQTLSQMHKEALLGSKDKKPNKSGWGVSGRKYAAKVAEFYRRLECTTCLDYGSGQETLRIELAKLDPPIRVSCYDPGIEHRRGMPKPCDLVVCTDVFEHVEESKLDNVIDHIYTLAGKGVFLAIATRPAKEILPDGRNAHITVHDANWWIERVKRWGGWTIEKTELVDHQLMMWIIKR